MRGAQAQRASEVSGAPQHGAAGGGVDDDGEVARQERDLGRRSPSRGPVVEAEAELGEAVEDPAGKAVGEEPALAVELRGHPDGRPPPQEPALRRGRGRGLGGVGDAAATVFVHGRGRGRSGEERGRRHVMRRGWARWREEEEEGDGLWTEEGTW